MHNALGKDMGMTTEMNTLLAAETIEKSCYTDDLMPSVPTVEQPTEMRRQLTELRDKKLTSTFVNGFPTDLK